MLDSTETCKYVFSVLAVMIILFLYICRTHTVKNAQKGLGVPFHTLNWTMTMTQWVFILAHCMMKINAYSFAEVSCGDIPALFVLGVAAASTSVDGHTGRLIEDVCGSPEFPSHVNTHFSGCTLSLPPFWLYSCTHTNKSQSFCFSLMSQLWEKQTYFLGHPSWGRRQQTSAALYQSLSSGGEAEAAGKTWRRQQRQKVWICTSEQPSMKDR